MSGLTILDFFLLQAVPGFGNLFALSSNPGAFPRLLSFFQKNPMEEDLWLFEIFVHDAADRRRTSGTA